MSSILNGSDKSFTDSNQHLSQGAYVNMLDKHGQSQMQQMQQQNQMYNSGAVQAEKSPYMFLSDWQEFADLIYLRYLDKSDVANSDDPELADSVMSDASKRHRGIKVGLTTMKVVWMFIFGAVGVAAMPLLIKESFDAIIVSIMFASIAFGYNYFYQFVMIQSRQYVVGNVTMELFKIMLTGYESFKTAVYLISAGIFTLSVLLSLYHIIPENIFMMQTIYYRLSFVGEGYFLIHVGGFLAINLMLLKIFEETHYLKYLEIAKKRKVARDMEVSTIGTVAHKSLKGGYEMKENSPREI